MTTLAELGEIAKADDRAAVEKSFIRAPGQTGYYRPLTVYSEQAGKHVRAGVTRQVRNTVKNTRNARVNGSTPRQQGGRDAAAKQQYLADRAAVKEARRAAREAGRTPFGTQAQGMEDIARSREAQANAERRKDVLAARKERAYVRNARRDYDKVDISGHIVGGLGSAAWVPVGAGAAGYAALKGLPHGDERLVKKELRSPSANEAAGAAGGAVAGLGAGGAVYTIGGGATKKWIARRRRDFLINNPDQRETQAREWKKHLRSHGVRSLTDNTSYDDRTRIKLTTPKTIHDWKLDRALAFKNLTPVRRAFLASTTLGGAAAGVKAVRSSERRRQG